MKNKLGFALCLLLAAVFTGCKEDEEGKHHFSNQVFISAMSFTDDVFIKRDNLDVTREESCDVTVAMAQPRERDITVTFAEAPGLLEHYRMFYDDPTAELLPANGGYYDFADISTVITAGMVESAPLTFAFTNLDNLPIEEKQRYVLPVRIVSADGMNILESARTVYFVFSKAALINVVAEMENNCAWPEWTADTEAVKDMETFTLEALVYANSFDRKISTIMGIEDTFLIRLGDDGRPTNQLQVAFAKKVSEEETSPARGKIPVEADSRYDLKQFVWQAEGYGQGFSIWYRRACRDHRQDQLRHSALRRDGRQGALLLDRPLVPPPVGRRLVLRASFRRHDGRSAPLEQGLDVRRDRFREPFLQDRSRIGRTGGLLEVRRQYEG